MWKQDGKIGKIATYFPNGILTEGGGVGGIPGFLPTQTRFLNTPLIVHI